MELSFFVPIIPRGQARVRHTVRGSRPVAYKSKDQQADERTLEALMMPHVPDVPLSGMLSLSLVITMPIPASFSKPKTALALHRSLRPTTKPDLSNVLKHVEDVMQRMRFFEDDKQIVDIYCCKIYGDHPGYRVHLRELQNG